MKVAQYKPLATKKLPKADREIAVLMGLVELYVKTGKPVGSHTLQEQGMEMLSSATIRNYFAKMEEQGYLKQQHVSGGRIPTQKAFRLYFDAQDTIEHCEDLEKVFQEEAKEIATTLHRAAEVLSERTKCAVFLSSPRFDQDFIQDIHFIGLDASKLLAVLITDFGLIRTEAIYLEQPVAPPFLEQCEEYFLWRLGKGKKPLFAEESDGKSAARIYNEIMVRHVVGYVNFSNEEVVRTGLSKLLAYPEFSEASSLANGLSLLENENDMRYLLRECCKENKLTCWIGDELCPYIPPESECAVLAIPYRINQTLVGAIALLGPMRLPYRTLCGVLHHFSEELSKVLTKSVYKYKITFRQPSPQGEKRLEQEILQSNRTLIENQPRK